MPALGQAVPVAGVVFAFAMDGQVSRTQAAASVHGAEVEVEDVAVAVAVEVAGRAIATHMNTVVGIRMADRKETKQVKGRRLTGDMSKSVELQILPGSSYDSAKHEEKDMPTESVLGGR